jgi:aspartate aminotransferase-like enzyme
VVGAQLALGREPGLLLSNGEFGERLVDHADGFGLDYVAHRIAWGAAFDLAEVERVVANRRAIRWLWAVHCETSTGVLNDLDGLKSLARRRGLKLCMDCVSSVGAVDTNLSGVYLAAGVSGKALAALPGLALVFIGGEFVPVAGKLPRYLDLTQYRRGVPFTLSSNLLVALDAALVDQTAERREKIARGARHLREQLAAAGIATVADASVAAPHVTTIALPQDLNSVTVATELATQGLLVAFASEYLRARNWLQVCLMGKFTFSSLDRLASALARKARHDRAA